MNEDLLTTAEAAALLGVSTRTVERLRRAGDLLCERRGSTMRPRVYYSRAELHSYMNRAARSQAAS